MAGQETQNQKNGGLVSHPRTRISPRTTATVFLNTTAIHTFRRSSIISPKSSGMTGYSITLKRDSGMRPENRHRYMNWLGKQLGYKKTDDWYQLTRRLLIQNHAGGLLDRFRDSPREILTDYLPEVDWKPWLFGMAQIDFWTKAENRRQVSPMAGRGTWNHQTGGLVSNSRSECFTTTAADR